MEDNKKDDEIFDFFTPLQVPAGLAVTDSEKAEGLPNSFEPQFRPVNGRRTGQLPKWLMR
jgi:hypothetical protein